MSSNGRTPGSGPGGWGSSPYTQAQTYIIYAPVAQLDRVSGYGPEGWGFESSRAYCKKHQKGAFFIQYYPLF